MLMDEVRVRHVMQITEQAIQQKILFNTILSYRIIRKCVVVYFWCDFDIFIAKRTCLKSDIEANNFFM